VPTGSPRLPLAHLPDFSASQFNMPSDLGFLVVIFPDQRSPFALIVVEVKQRPILSAVLFFSLPLYAYSQIYPIVYTPGNTSEVEKFELSICC